MTFREVTSAMAAYKDVNDEVSELIGNGQWFVYSTARVVAVVTIYTRKRVWDIVKWSMVGLFDNQRDDSEDHMKDEDRLKRWETVNDLCLTKSAMAVETMPTKRLF